MEATVAVVLEARIAGAMPAAGTELELGAGAEAWVDAARGVRARGPKRGTLLAGRLAARDDTWPVRFACDNDQGNG